MTKLRTLQKLNITFFSSVNSDLMFNIWYL